MTAGVSIAVKSKIVTANVKRLKIIDFLYKYGIGYLKETSIRIANYSGPTLSGW